MKIPHAVTWAQTQAANALAQRALRVYADEAEPAVDRSSLRAKWCAAVVTLGPRWLLVKPVGRLTAVA